MHLDVDLYRSTLQCLEYFWPRVLPGGVLLSHDYSILPGVKQAFTEFTERTPEKVIELPTTQCMLIKSTHPEPPFARTRAATANHPHSRRKRLRVDSVRMPKLVIKPVETSREKKQFLLLPWEIYRGDPNWVPPLRTTQKELVGYAHHPFYDDAEGQTFLALHDGKPVGRILALVNHAHNRQYNEKRGFFGFFECDRRRGGCPRPVRRRRQLASPSGA